jgi:hypothetical protein
MNNIKLDARRIRNEIDLVVLDSVLRLCFVMHLVHITRSGTDRLGNNLVEQQHGDF